MYNTAQASLLVLYWVCGVDVFKYSGTQQSARRIGLCSIGFSKGVVFLLTLWLYVCVDGYAVLCQQLMHPFNNPLPLPCLWLGYRQMLSPPAPHPICAKLRLC
jgi:hypothetical protein